MPINRLTHAALSHLDRLQDGEHILDGAPARCRELDERHMTIFEEAAGGTAGVRRWAQQHGVSFVNLLEADLVVTNRALCYVTYHPKIAAIAEWDFLSGVETEKPKFLQVTSPLTVVYRTGHRQVFEVSRGAVESIASHVRNHLFSESGL